MNKLMQVFRYHGAQVRVVERHGEPWFVAKDVCEALDYTWQPALVVHVPNEWKDIIPTNTPGGTQDMLALSEPGLFFFLGRSDKPAALPFQKWVYGEILPSIRKTGSYSVKALPASYAEALRELADTVDAKALLEAKIETDKPAVDFAHRVKDATGQHNMKEAAKILGWGPNLLFAHLRNMRVFMSNNTPLQKFIDRGYFVVHENLITMSGQDFVKPQTFVTPKGLIWLQKVAPIPAKHGFPGHRPGGPGLEEQGEAHHA